MVWALPIHDTCFFMIQGEPKEIVCSAYKQINAPVELRVTTQAELRRAQNGID